MVYVALTIQWCRAEGASLPPKVLICQIQAEFLKIHHGNFDTFVSC